MNEYDKAVAGMNLGEPLDDPYGAAIDSAFASKQQAASVSAFAAAKKNPDQHAEALQLSRKTGLPLDFIERNKDAVKERESRGAVDYDAVLKNFGKTSLLLQDPIIAPMVTDDIDNLTGIEKVFRAGRDYTGAFGGGGASGVGMGLQGGAAMQRAFSRRMQGLGEAIGLPPEVAYNLTRTNPIFAASGIAAPIWDYVGKKAEQFGEFISPPKDRQTVGTDVAGALGQVTTQVALSLLNPTLAVGMMAGQGAEMQERRVEEAGALGTAGGDAAIFLGAGITAATEKVQLGILMKRVPILHKLVERMPAQIQNKWLNQVVDISAAGVSEAAQETIEGFAHDVAEYALYNPDVEFMKGWEREAIAAGGAGGIFRGVANMIMKGRARVEENAAAAKTEGEQAGIAALDKLAQESKLLARDPQSFEQHVKRSADGSGAENVYINGERLQEFFQSGADVKAIVEVAPELQQQLPEALATGGDVIVPVEKVMRLMAGGQIQELYQDMRLSVDSMSARDAAEQKKTTQAEGPAAEEEAAVDPAEEAGQQIYDDFYQKQIAAGVPPLQAQHNATLAQQGMLAFGARYGLDPLELYKAEGIEIQRAQGDEKIASDALAQVSPEQVSELNTPLELPVAKEFSEAVTNTSGAEITAEGLRINLVRYQKPEQEGAQSVRTGVFYLPKGSKSERYYRNQDTTKGGNAYGGAEKFEGETLIRRPLFVKGSTGGKAPEAAYDTINGKGAYAKMAADVRHEVSAYGLSRDEQIFLIKRVLEKYGAGSNLAYEIHANSKFGNTKAYAVIENIVAHAVRNAGYDAVVGYSKSRGAEGKPFISEVFDVREQTYPARGMDSEIHETFFQSPTSQPITETPEFKAWFGDSKVVDADGKPLVVYHGTNKDFDRFKAGKDKGSLAADAGAGIFFSSDSDVAHYFAWNAPRKKGESVTEGNQILPTYLSLKNPLERDFDGEWKKPSEVKKMADAAKASGNDGLILRNIRDGANGKAADVYVAFSPTQIKSINNRGTFDPNDARILYQFAGERAATADKFRLDNAKERIERGEDAEAVRKETGWFKGVDGKWRFEISDADASLEVDAKGQTMLDKLKEWYGQEFWLDFVLKHDRLFAAYPALEQVKVTFSPLLEGKKAAGYDPHKNTILISRDIDMDGALSLILHEVQHAIQKAEGFAAGGDAFTDPNYRRLAGEVEARNTEKRRTMTDKERVEVSPESTQDVANAEAIVIFNDDLQLAAPPALTQPDGSGFTPRGSIRAAEGKAIITLFEKSDASTIIHEMGHQFVFMLSRLSQSENAPQQAKDDLETLMKFTGQTDYDAFNKSVDAQEKLARGFEAYVMEGKAPSQELRGAFARFSAWLTRIYRTIRALDVQLNDDVRAVFDRMLATDEQIEAARAVQEMKADPAILELLTEAEKKDYIKRQERAKEAAETELRNKLMREIEREKLEWWKQESEQVAIEVEDELRSTREYQVLDYLKDGKVLSEAHGERQMEFVRMDKATLVRMFGKERVEGLRKRLGTPLYVTKDGASPEVVAETFGFSSAAEMFAKLEQTLPLKEAVKKNTEEVMKLRHGDILNDGSIEEEAVAATHNDEQAAAIAGELAALARKSGNRRMNVTREAIKQLAEDTVARKRVGDVKKYMRYYYAGIKAAKEAGAALAKKDYAKASEAKRKQLLNHYLYTAHREAALEMDKAQKYLRRFDNNKVRGGIRTEYMEQIDALLEGVDFRKNIPANQIGRTDRLLKARMTADAFRAFVAAKDAEGDALAVDDRLTLPAGVKSYKEMSIDELRGLRDTVQNLEHLARLKNRLILNGRKRELEEVADEVVNTITENVKARQQAVNTHRPSEKRGRFMQSAFGLITKAQTWLEEMDGGKKIGAVYNALKRDLDEGGVERVRREREAAEHYYGLMAKHYGKAKAKFGDSEFVLTLANLRKVNIFVPEINTTLSKEEVLAVALNWGNADNRAKLMEGRGWNETQIQAVLAKLEPEDVAFVNDVREWIESFWPEIEARERNRTGVIPEKVKGDDAQLSAGTIKGGYYPLKYDGNLDYDTRAQDVEQNFNEMRTGKYQRAQTRRGHTKKRVEGVQKPVRLDLGVITEHVNQVIADVTIGEAVENTHRILHHKSVKKAISEHMGVETFQQLDMWLKDTAATGVAASDGLSAIMRNLRVSLSVGAMGLKLGTTLMQISGYSQSVVEIGPKWMLKGFTKFLAGTPWKMAEQVHDMSPFMKQRATTLQRDMLDAIRAADGKGAITNIQKLYFWPMVKMQMMVDVPTFIGAYEKALADGRTDVDAVRYAEQSVENAQGSGMVTALSAMERGTLNQNTRFSESVRLWTMFYSYFNTKLNLAIRQTKGTNFKDPVQVAKLGSDYLMLFWLEALVGELIAGRMPDFEDDEDNALWWNVKLAMKSMMGTIPMMREVVSGLGGFGSGPAGARGLDDVARGIKGVSSAVEDAVNGEEIDYYALTKGLIGAGNVISPLKLPTSQIGIALDAMKRADEGEDVAPVDYVLRPPKNNN